MYKTKKKGQVRHTINEEREKIEKGRDKRYPRRALIPMQGAS